MTNETRREFLKKTALLLGAGATGTALNTAGCAPSTAPLLRAQVTDSVLRFDTAIPELALSGDGVALVSDYLEYPILLIRRTDGTFSAISAECTHLGCIVKKQKLVLRCPCHGSAYDFEGTVLNGPTEVPLHQFRAKQTGTIVEIRL
ncbi:MAG: ubiquinol-cytochrome c reductase iron-sulfur subunit [Ignavibacteriales bacterium]|nr:ubiquinol-cytochrome c reductase iron-sulfur subunit [Ignavibacteriales bacterium]